VGTLRTEGQAAFDDMAAISDPKFIAELLSREHYWKTEGFRRIDKKRKEATSAVTSTAQVTTEPGLRSLSEQLEDLRSECDISIEELADKVGIDPTNVSRHLNGKSTPSRKTRGSYGRAFSKLLNQKILINQTQVKRSQNAAKKLPDA
jgi:DNA-binding XRE family transcriptional regulator